MDEVARIFGPGGPLQQRFGDRFEPRPQQRDMATAISRAIEDGRHLVVEAGTGVGKSFAYLIPAIRYAIESNSRVVISTHTIALQEQLMGKDIPLLAELMPPFRAVLVKGRSNYVSLRRFKFAYEQRRSLFVGDDDAVAQFERLAEWLREDDSDGSRASLDFRPNAEIWDAIASESDNCLGLKCETHRQCHYFKARRGVSEAQILVVNHALFLSDVVVRQGTGGFGILPDYGVVVFDEAHTLEQVAVDHFGFRLTSSGLDYHLSRLRGKSRADKGYLATYGWSREATLVETVRNESRRYFEKVWATISKSDAAGYQRLHEPLPGLPVVVSAIDDLVGSLADRIPQLKSEDQALELKAIINRTGGLGTAILNWHRQAMSARTVYWMEAEASRKVRGQAGSSQSVLPDRFTLAAVPLDIGSEFRSRILAGEATCVMTSATLCVGHPPQFDFFHERIGYDVDAGDSIQLDSPFDYVRQARIVTYPELPDPSTERSQFFLEASSVVRDRVLANAGRTLVLFTSYEMLRTMAAQMRNDFADAGIRLLVQGEGPPPATLVAQFMQGGPGVLFGTDSFWQGVDIPGDRLTQVIVVKLPFSVPDHPLMQARLDDIRRRGGNPFFDYQLPEAVIKLKQGFGRLIRSATDWGEVHILDPRLYTKGYGAKFLDSLPQCSIDQVRNSKSRNLKNSDPSDGPF
jgi:ATP-dependent DNA helicase DinG